MRALRLRVTLLTAGLLVLAPALLLWRLPRPQATGLDRLLPQMALLQSLPAVPSRPVPQLWRQRLGEPLAQRLWAQQRRLWWQGWGRHGDGGAYLLLPMGRSTSLPAGQRPPHSLLLDDVLVVAADPLSLRLLQDQLQRAQRPVRGLEHRCLNLLQQSEAVFWKPAGLGGLSGSLAPLLLGYQEGCLALRLESNQLLLEGEAASKPDPWLEPQPGEAPPPPPPLAGQRLLVLEGSSLQPLFEGLLGRQLVLDALADRYGIGEGELRLLRRLPFRLQLSPLAAGPFRAGLELQLQVAPSQRQALERLLRALAPRLQALGLAALSPPQASPAPILWRRDDGVVVGGWRWLEGPDQRRGGLLLFLGPEPRASGWIPLGPFPPGGNALRLQLRPAAMAAAGLLPPELPPLLRRASTLEMASGSAGSSLSRLRGRLQLAPSAAGR